MDDFELLQQLFGDKLIQAEEGGYGRPQLILQEEDYYSICIRNVRAPCNCCSTSFVCFLVVESLIKINFLSLLITTKLQQRSK
jgi:hypothetical protein